MANLVYGDLKIKGSRENITKFLQEYKDTEENKTILENTSNNTSYKGTGNYIHNKCNLVITVFNFKLHGKETTKNKIKVAFMSKGQLSRTELGDICREYNLEISCKYTDNYLRRNYTLDFNDKGELITSMVREY